MDPLLQLEILVQWTCCLYFLGADSDSIIEKLIFFLRYYAQDLLRVGALKLVIFDHFKIFFNRTQFWWIQSICICQLLVVALTHWWCWFKPFILWKITMQYGRFLFLSFFGQLKQQLRYIYYWLTSFLYKYYRLLQSTLGRNFTIICVSYWKKNFSNTPCILVAVPGQSVGEV